MPKINRKIASSTKNNYIVGLVFPRFFIIPPDQKIFFFIFSYARNRGNCTIVSLIDFYNSWENNFNTALLFQVVTSEEEKKVVDSELQILREEMASLNTAFAEEKQLIVETSEKEKEKLQGLLNEANHKIELHQEEVKEWSAKHSQIRTELDESKNSHEEKMIALNENLQTKFESERESLMNSHREQQMLSDNKLDELNFKLSEATGRYEVSLYNVFDPGHHSRMGYARKRGLSSFPGLPWIH